MKKVYQKPEIEMMGMEQENMMAVSGFDIMDGQLGASDSYSQYENYINVWE